MSLKPVVMREVAADAPTMIKVLGPKLGKKFTANPTVAKYAFVLKFPSGVATGRAVERSLKKLGSGRGPTLIAGDQLTLEARQVATEERCDLVASGSEAFLWSDADYATAREPLSSD